MDAVPYSGEALHSYSGHGCLQAQSVHVMVARFGEVVDAYDELVPPSQRHQADICLVHMIVEDNQYNQEYLQRDD